MNSNLLTAQEAAERLHLSVATIRAWILYRKIEYTKLNGRAVRIPVSAIEQIVTAGTVPVREAVSQ